MLLIISFGKSKNLFGNKIKGNPNIALVESNDLITDEI